MSLKELLHQAGLSKTAYYHLIQKENLLPKSVLSLAAALQSSPSELLSEKEDIPKALQKVKRLRKRLAQIMARHPEVDPQNAWHTLLLLELPPWERLQRSLIRSRNYMPKNK